MSFLSWNTQNNQEITEQQLAVNSPTLPLSEQLMVAANLEPHPVMVVS